MIFSGGGLELYLNKTTFAAERLTVLGDPERVSWCRGRNFGLPSGNNFLVESSFAPDKCVAEFLYFDNITCTLEIAAKDGAISYRYLFRNAGKKTVSLKEGELGVYTSFYDDFDEPTISLRRRVHAHVRTQGTTHVYCERYSGELPSLGLAMVKGESFSYSLERTADKGARGDILLNLPEMTLAVGDSYECEFLIFSCTGREDFFRKAEGYGLLTATASELAVFEGEEIVVESSSATSLRVGEDTLPFVDGRCSFLPQRKGAGCATVSAGERSLVLKYFVIEKDVADKRAAFVTEKQYLSEGKYAGAFTAFDTKCEEILLHGGVRSPFNAAGFRAAPLLFLLAYARTKEIPDPLREKILRAIEFYDREVYRGGEIADDVGGKRARIGKRYYNYSLFAAIKLEEYRFGGKIEDLLQSAVILSNLYRSGSLYESVPTVSVVEALREAERDQLADELRDEVVAAADKIIAGGNKYAPFKGLPYGPEIVYGSLSALLDAYFLTEKSYYLQTASEHLSRLAAFSFPSLDYATSDVPEIFQRDRGNSLYYDMSPHFTAAHLALVYEKFSRASGDPAYRAIAERIMRATLTLFDANGKGHRSKAAAKSVNDFPLGEYEEISYGEDVILYHFGLLFGGI